VHNTGLLTSTAPPPKLSLTQVVQGLSLGALSPQVLMDSIEAVTMTMGLNIQTIIDNGWRYAQADRMNTPVRLIPVLSLHFIQLRTSALDAVLIVRSALGPVNAVLNISITDKLIGGTLLGSAMAEVDILGPGLYHVHAAIPLPSVAPFFGTKATQLAVRIGFGCTTLTSFGIIQSPVGSTKWPLFCDPLSQREIVGVLLVSGENIAGDVAQMQKAWTPAMAAAYATTLGTSLACTLSAKRQALPLGH
jgi:hypothetical protein